MEPVWVISPWVRCCARNRMKSPGFFFDFSVSNSLQFCFYGDSQIVRMPDLEPNWLPVKLDAAIQLFWVMETTLTIPRTGEKWKVRFSAEDWQTFKVRCCKLGIDMDNTRAPSHIVTIEI